MLQQRLIAPQRPHGAVANVRVHVQKPADKVALIRVARPDPAVPLDAVQKKFPAVELEGIGRRVPDIRQQPVGAGKAPPALQRYALIFRPQAKLRLAGNEDIPERPGREADGGSLRRHGLDQQTGGYVPRLGFRFAEADGQFRLIFPFQKDPGEGLPAKVVQRSLLVPGDVDGAYLLIDKGKNLRVLLRPGEQGTGTCGNLCSGKGLHRPAFRSGQAPFFHIQAGQTVLPAQVDHDLVSPGGQGDFLSERIQSAVHAHVARAPGLHGQPLRRGQLCAAEKAGAVPAVVHRPERRPVIIPLLPPGVELQSVAEFEISGIPDPAGRMIHGLVPLF